MSTCSTTGQSTPLEVRDMIIKCFTSAHQKDAAMVFQNDNEAYMYCSSIVKKCFDDIQEDFNNPSKQSLLKIIDCLADFAQHFRDKKTIAKNHEDMLTMVSML